ncbi:MAG: indole-3-glycerol phosphate synthase TrpC [Candidatus Helarchaeota archaeon]
MNVLDEIFEHRKKILKTFLKNYKIPNRIVKKKKSMIKGIKNSNTTPIISEVKFASPSKGQISSIENIESIAKKMEQGGAVGISVLTEPKFFNGSFEILRRVRNTVTLPLLLKDFIFDPKQIFHGAELGADVILIISKILPPDIIRELYNLAISLDLEALVEIHDLSDLKKIQGFKPEIIGINNRNLQNLKVEIKNSINIIPEVRNQFSSTLIVSESGIYTRNDIQELTNAGADAFLIGSSIMEAPDIQIKLKTLLGGN